MGFLDSINGFLGQANGVLGSVGDTLGQFQAAKNAFGSPSILLPTGGLPGGGFTGTNPFLVGNSPADSNGMDTSTVVLVGGLAVLVVLVLVLLM